ncbi:hypothetical protein HN803_08040 [candidate division WWE3 bacterium]|nr:hypothetical protein [candidate division WWE3 bacterium]MBT7350703.1 hypothetical protein [candidate division WWE3 bacterium]
MLLDTVKNCQYIFYPHITKNEFIIGSLLLLISLSWYLFKQAESRIEYVLTGIVLGGAFGNVLERFLSGCVTDYLNFFGLFHFNLWDLMISGGVLIFISKYLIKNIVPTRHVQS